MKRIDKEDFKSSILEGMNMKSILINESGLYLAILGSKLESAKSFKRWIILEGFSEDKLTSQIATSGQNRNMLLLLGMLFIIYPCSRYDIFWVCINVKIS